MRRKLFLLLCASIFISCSICSMDYGLDLNLEMADHKTILCPLKWCKLSRVLRDAMELVDETTQAVPLPRVTEEHWNLLVCLLPLVFERDLNGIHNLLTTSYSLQELIKILQAAEYLDIRTDDNGIILTEIIAEDIARSFLLTEDSKQKFLSSDTFLNKFDSISDDLSHTVARKIMKLNLGFKTRLLQECLTPCNVLKGHTDAVFSVAFNKSGEKIVSSSKDNMVRIWDVKTGTCERVLNEHTDAVGSAVFNEAGDKIVSASNDRTVRIWDVKSGKCERVLNGHSSWVGWAVFNQAGDKIVSASRDRTVRIWDVKSGECERVFVGPPNCWINYAAFNKTEDKIVSTSAWDDTIRIWDIKTGICERILVGTYLVHSDQINKAEKKEIRIFGDGMLEIWDVKTKEVTAPSNGTEKILLEEEIKSAKCEHILSGHTEYVYSARFNAVGDKIVSASGDRTVRIWNLNNFLFCGHYLKNKLTLEQALLLVCWNDVIVNNGQFDISKKSHLQKIFESIDNETIRGIIQTAEDSFIDVCSVVYQACKKKIKDRVFK